MLSNIVPGIVRLSTTWCTQTHAHAALSRCSQYLITDNHQPRKPSWCELCCTWYDKFTTPTAATEYMRLEAKGHERKSLRCSLQCGRWHGLALDQARLIKRGFLQTVTLTVPP